MLMTKVTSKGQVTIPVEIRRSLAIKEGDGLLFETLETDAVRVRVIRRRRLTDLAGALPATRSYPGRDAVRDAVGRDRGEELDRRGRQG